MSGVRSSARRRIAVNVATAIVAFMLGASTIVFAASSGALKVEAFNLADGTNPSQLAKVDANGNVAVSVMNAPTVQPKRQPFQQVVSAHSLAGLATCDAVVVPAGMRLTIQAFSAQAFSVGGTQPTVYLETAVTQGGSTTQLVSIALELRLGLAHYWSGDVQTLLFTGATSDPTGRTFSYAACVGNPNDAESIFSGVISGYLETAP